LIKYFTAKYTGEGFITHEDQEQQGLRFEILPGTEDMCKVKVEGNEDKIAQWAARVAATEITEAEYTA